MKPRVSMITLGVRNLAAATKFYEEGLGFPRMESGPESGRRYDRSLVLRWTGSTEHPNESSAYDPWIETYLGT